MNYVGVGAETLQLMAPVSSSLFREGFIQEKILVEFQFRCEQRRARKYSLGHDWVILAAIILTEYCLTMILEILHDSRLTTIWTLLGFKHFMIMNFLMSHQVLNSGRLSIIFVKKIKTPGRYVAVAQPELVRKKTLKAVKHILGCPKCGK